MISEVRINLSTDINICNLDVMNAVSLALAICDDGVIDKLKIRKISE